MSFYLDFFERVLQGLVVRNDSRLHLGIELKHCLCAAFKPWAANGKYYVTFSSQDNFTRRALSEIALMSLETFRFGPSRWKFGKKVHKNHTHIYIGLWIYQLRDKALSENLSVFNLLYVHGTRQISLRRSCKCTTEDKKHKSFTEKL